MRSVSSFEQPSTELVELRYRLRHSAAHVTAGAVMALFPTAKLGVGPPTEDGFYYDFLVDHPFTPEDLESIEKKVNCFWS